MIKINEIWSRYAHWKESESEWERMTHEACVWGNKHYCIIGNLPLPVDICHHRWHLSTTGGKNAPLMVRFRYSSVRHNTYLAITYQQSICICNIRVYLQCTCNTQKRNGLKTLRARANIYSRNICVRRIYIWTLFLSPFLSEIRLQIGRKCLFLFLWKISSPK